MTSRARPSPKSGIHRVVADLLLMGHSLDEVAALVGMSRRSLSKRFPEEIHRAHVINAARIGERLIAEALAGNMSAALFYLKARAGMRAGTRTWKR